MKQAAQEFGTSAHTLRLAAKQGKLPGARRIGGRWFVHRATLEKYFESSLSPEQQQPTAA
jgi:excisionase family DNA binding protein